MSLNKCTDAELWEAICQNDRKAFDVLFERYWAPVYKTAGAYLKDGDAVSQIVHDIFLNIWEKRHSYEIRCFKTYLTTAARYHVFKTLKARKSDNIVLIEDYSKLEAFSMSENEGAKNIQTQELKKELEASLSQLPKRCQEIFSLSRTSQLSNDEIAEKLSISKRTVENQLTVALQYLRGVLKFLPYQPRSR
jgi:RNA polymerase sigma-70 factor (family 1)